MSDASPEPSEQPQAPRETSAMPFIVALVGVGLLVAVVVGWNVFSSNTELSEANQISRVTSDFINVHNNDDEDARAKIVCPTYAADRSPLAELAGDVTFVSVDNVQLDGEQATAQVSVRSESGDTTSRWQYARTGQKWRVCN